MVFLFRRHLVMMEMLAKPAGRVMLAALAALAALVGMGLLVGLW